MKRFASTSAFTLIELLLGLTILALVMGSLFTTIQVGMDAYKQGRYTMELYQSGRIALHKISDEMLLALAPASFWQPRDTYRQLTVDELMLTFKGTPIQEEDPGAIRFIGTSNTVQYVRKKYHLDQYPPFDLEECIIYADQGRLYLNVIRSLLEVKQATWYYAQIFQVQLNGIVVPSMGGRARFRAQGELGEPPLWDWIGDTGIRNKRSIIAEGIRSIAFRYSDDGRWKSSWDSQDLETIHKISPSSPNFQALQDTLIQEKGPPQVVEITLTLENGENLITAADIPSGNMRAAVFGGGRPPNPLPPKPATNLTNRFDQNETPVAVP